MRGPAGARISVSARRRAARNSRLSIIEAVRARWLTMDPARGRQTVPVVTSNSSAAWSRANSKALRRSMRLKPWAISRSSSTDFTSEPSCSAGALRVCGGVELALDAVGLAVEQVDERPEEIGEIVLEARARQHGAEGLDH